MNLDLYSNQVTVVGMALTIIVASAGLMKAYRNNKVIIVMLVVTAIIAIVGVFLMAPATMTDRATKSEWFFSPIIFISSYALLRRVYKKKYSREPTYNRTALYDAEEGRNQNSFDVVVHVLPLVFSIVLPIIISSMH